MRITVKSVNKIYFCGLHLYGNPTPLEVSTSTTTTTTSTSTVTSTSTINNRTIWRGTWCWRDLIFPSLSLLFLFGFCRIDDLVVIGYIFLLIIVVCRSGGTLVCVWQSSWLGTKATILSSNVWSSRTGSEYLVKSSNILRISIFWKVALKIRHLSREYFRTEFDNPNMVGKGKVLDYTIGSTTQFASNERCYASLWSENIHK